jgi:hypothetical protein
MFQKDTQHRFRAIGDGGFEILEPSVRDTALHTLEKELGKLSSLKEEKMLITVEFARSNYEEAMKLFKSAFLQDARFLFLAADLNACFQRVQQRIKQPTTEDDYSVSSSDINFASRYSSQYMPPRLAGKKIDIIDNTAEKSLNDLAAQVKTFFKQVSSAIEAFIHRDTEPLPNIDATSAVSEDILIQTEEKSMEVMIR